MPLFFEFVSRNKTFRILTWQQRLLTAGCSTYTIFPRIDGQGTSFWLFRGVFFVLGIFFLFLQYYTVIRNIFDYLKRYVNVCYIGTITLPVTTEKRVQEQKSQICMILPTKAVQLELVTNTDKQILIKLKNELWCQMGCYNAMIIVCIPGSL